jgi:hypothetical protein
MHAVLVSLRLRDAMELHPRPGPCRINHRCPGLTYTPADREKSCQLA